MDLHRAVIRIAVASAALVAVLTGCAVPAGPGTANGPPERPALEMPVPDPSQQVWALATVIDDGSGAQLCPIVLESYPPQCGGGIPLEGWSWDDFAAGQEGVPDQDGEVRWGFYAVYGLYDGERLKVTLPAEFGGAIDVRPRPTTGPLTEEETARVLRQIKEDLPGDYGSAEGDGVVLIDVTWDDGSLQREMDERFGEGAVVVNSFFRPFDLS